MGLLNRLMDVAASKSVKLLLVEDSEADALLVVEQLRRNGYAVDWKRVQGKAELEAALAGKTWDAIIADQSLPQYSAMAALHCLKETGKDIPFIIVSGTIGEENAVTAMKAGAHDYIMKDHLGRLAPALERELREAEVRRQRRQAEESLHESEARMAALVRSAMDAIVTIDEEQRITVFNSAAEKMFGYSSAQMLGQPLERLIPARFFSAHAHGVREFGKTDATSRAMGAFGSIRGLRANGEEFPIEASLSQIEIGGKKYFTAILRDVAERHRYESELENSQKQLRALAAKQESVREEERKHITRDIHDELGAALTGFKMDLAWMRNRLQGDEPKAKREILNKIKEMGGLIDETSDLIRKLCTELRPGILDDLGLAAAAEWQAKEFTKRTGIQCKFSAPADGLALDSERATAVFRIFQEILTNVSRHAKSSEVQVELKVSKNELILEAKDNGRGIEKKDLEGVGSLGLVGMRERALALGGKIEFHGEPSKGTTVKLTIPVNHNHEKEKTMTIRR